MVRQPRHDDAPRRGSLRQAALRVARLRTCRDGVTIIEVLFAIGVILIGLLGVLAVIPIAGRDAGEAIRLDAANRIAAGIADELQARDLASLDGLVYVDNDPSQADDFLTTSQILTPFVNYPAENAPTNLGNPWRSLGEVIDAPVVPNTTGSGPPNIRIKGLDSPGLASRFPGSGPTYRTTRMASFCLDPDFFSKNATGALGGTRNAYQPSRFPYYSEWYSGVTDPAANLGSVGAMPPMPRMYRVGAGGTSGGGGAFAASVIADALTHADGSLMMYRPKDKTLAPSQVMNNLDVAGATAGSRRSPGRYTWLATVTPPLDNSNHYNVTVVVIESREAFANLYDAASAPPVSSADVNPASERVFWVTNPVQLGSTIEVTAYGPNTVDDSIRVGQWVMLSRQVYQTSNGFPTGNPVQPHPTQPAVHRWYRVQRVLGREEGAFTQPPFDPTSGVWRRQVVLEGPNWQFGFENNGNGGAAEVLLADDTYMTVVSGAVSIKEFTLELEF